ncbi:hypothetical protein ACJQWK_03802 [Exserohilum turcicum]
MAPDTARHADVKEKQQISHIEDTGIPAESELASSQETHAEGVDINNTHALKGDASEGKVQWSTRSILAAMCLAGLVYRVADYPVLHPWLAPLHRTESGIVFNAALSRFRAHTTPVLLAGRVS